MRVKRPSLARKRPSSTSGLMPASARRTTFRTQRSFEPHRRVRAIERGQERDEARRVRGRRRLGGRRLPLSAKLAMAQRRDAIAGDDREHLARHARVDGTVEHALPRAGDMRDDRFGRLLHDVSPRRPPAPARAASRIDPHGRPRTVAARIVTNTGSSPSRSVPQSAILTRSIAPFAANHRWRRRNGAR